jgi:hypothetical protein
MLCTARVGGAPVVVARYAAGARVRGTDGALAAAGRREVPKITVLSGHKHGCNGKFII